MLELISKFSKVEGHKVNIKKLVAFLYTNTEIPEKEIKQTIPFTIASKNMKYLGMKVTKEIKDLTLKTMTVMKENETQINGRIVCAYG